MPQQSGVSTHLSRVRPFVASLFFLLVPCGACHAAIAPDVVERGKSATAYVNVGTGSGSAFCINVSGLFVTDAHVVKDARKISLVLEHISE